MFQFQWKIKNPFFPQKFSGGISVAWVELNSDRKPEITMLEPYVDKDFKYPTSSIGDLIKGIDECTHLYPNVPKEKAFGRFYKRVGRRNGYRFITHIWRRK